MAVRTFALLFVLWLVAATGATHGQSSAGRALQQAVALLGALPAGKSGLVLAAEASAEGHWTFVNPAGERFTTASPEELKRVLPTLAPESAKPGARLTLLVTEDTVFRQRKHFTVLSLANDRRTDLMIAVDREAYPLARRGERLYAEIRPSLLVELTERRLFDEAVWQLAHPLKRASIRVLALEPGGPTSVVASPKLDPQTQRALTDQIAPSSLVAAIRSLARQTVVLTARREGDTMMFRPASGPEQALPLKDVLAAAEAADVNLVLLQSASPRQPGARSWWWGRISVGRLGDALGRDHLADFINALGSTQTKMLVAVEDLGAGRTRLSAQPMKDESSPRTGIGNTLSELASGIVGQVVVSGVEASLRDRSRQTELDRRLVPGVPSVLQWIYGALLALGLAGHSIGKAWWARIWPPEARESYGGAFGYMAAQGVRRLAYVTTFMPLAGIASAPLAVMRALGGRARQSVTGAA